MAQQIADTLTRTRGTIVQDAIGAASLVVILFVGLTLPGMI